MFTVDVQAVTEAVRGLLSNPLVLLAAAATIVLTIWRSALARVPRILAELFFSNWQLGLLASTGLILSLASGWTTWDGMRNFTGEPILSAMVTFGIQGVMLIVAWLIGESFATGMNMQSARSIKERAGTTYLGVAIGFALLGILLAAVGGALYFMSAMSTPAVFMALGAALALIGLFLVAARADTMRSYGTAMRIMVRSAVLWVMFLACMATSVFFSFDSLFSTIFPQEERKRAAELRAQNQVAGVVSDIGALIATRQLTEAEALFSTKGWQEYDRHLTLLARAASDSQGAIESFFVQQMEARKQAIQQQQERIATAQSSQAGLSTRQLSLRDELTRLEAERPSLLSAFTERKQVVEEKVRALDAKRVEAMAEERGVEGTGKAGQGPQYRARRAEEGRMRDEVKIAEERQRDAERPLRAAETRIATIKRELATIDGDIAKLKGEAQTAEQRIRVAQEAGQTDDGPKVDPARILPSFEKLRAEFRQSPKADTLAQVQQMCVQMVGAMGATPTTREKVRGIDCDPKSASEAAGRVFALNDGIRIFSANCAGGDKLANYRTADELFGFARKCVQDSGLPSKDTDTLRQQINFIELNRDDKANRFVVTWNAFQDGNRLAYLALAIAIAIDSLVFMSGLFGANAVRSPLSDVPTDKARSADQLERIIDNALLPNRYQNARLAIEAMHADTSRPGYSAMVNMGELDPEHASATRKVLNAGATIGAVVRDEHDPRCYFVRPELFEYLSIASARAFEKDGKHLVEDIGESVKLAQLEKDLTAALIPSDVPADRAALGHSIARNAQVVLDHLHPYPVKESPEFANEIRLDEFESAEEKRIARRALTAGSSIGYVQAATYKGDDDKTLGQNRYVLHTGFVKTLTRLRAKMLLSSSNNALAIGQSPRDGGWMRASDPRLSDAAPPTAMLPGMSDHPTSVPVQRASAPGRAAKSDAKNYDRELIEHFAREMGQHAQSIDNLLATASQIDVPSLWRAMDQVLRNDDAGLRRPIRQAMTALEAGIDDARANAPADLIADPQATSQLNEIADRLKGMQPVMLVMGGGAYQNLLTVMEQELGEDRALGRLDEIKLAKHRYLVDHRADLARALESGNWTAVSAALQRFAVRLASLAGSDHRPSRIS
ncbi:MAG: hypothetical protein KGP27_13085 [Hyphomicrobiales bacterium]|nr:hypothetical protein [Hyphomicrobiales bacterium]